MPRALIALSLFLAAVSQAAERAQPPSDPPFPILAWGGPPQAQTTPERYRELADCGFTWNYSGFSSADEVAKTLDVAAGAGVKLVIACPQVQTDPEGTAKRFKTHPALGGYYLRDEPPATLFAELAAWAKRIQSVDADHPCYINLFPNYATAEQLATPDYQTHVDRFVAEVPVPIISFDHYPVVGRSLRGEWYQNLEVIAAAARKAGKPFWAFALSVAHDPYPVATPAHLRVQVYSNLAYGAQGIQYFTYWTSISDTWNFHEAPILPDGRRGAVYDRVKEVNREIQALRGVFLGAKVMSVGHTGATLPAGTRKYEPAAPVKAVTTQGDGAVVSVLEKGGRRFLVIVNRDIHNAMPVQVQFEAAAKAHAVRKDGTLGDVEALHGSEVGPGDALLFAWEKP